MSNYLEHLNLWHFETSWANQKCISLFMWNPICTSKIRLLIADDIGITGIVEVVATSNCWTIGRVIESSIGTLVLIYMQFCYTNFIWRTLQGEQETFIRLTIFMNRCPWSIIKYIKYESTSTLNHCNACTLVVTLGMETWSLPSILWALIQDIKNFR